MAPGKLTILKGAFLTDYSCHSKYSEIEFW
jgi:hypothetical protein